MRVLLEHRSRKVAVAAAQSQHRLLRCIITVTPSDGNTYSIVTVAIAASRAAPHPARPAPAQLPSPPGSQGVSDDNRRAIVTQQGSPPHWRSPAFAPSPLQRTPSTHSSFQPCPSSLRDEGDQPGLIPSASPLQHATRRRTAYKLSNHPESSTVSSIAPIVAPRKNISFRLVLN